MFVLPMSFFTYDKSKKNFLGSMSDAHIGANGRKNIADGFYIQSPKTLKCVFFKYDFITKNTDGDYESYEFTSNEGFSVTLIND